MKANVKYNKAFEATKSLTQFLAQVNNEDFLGQIKMVNQLTELVRRGLPDDVRNTIQNHFQETVSKLPQNSRTPVDETPVTLLKHVHPEHKEELAG